jgi:hypothetical protein
MSTETAAKVTGAHLARTAYLYVRQSTLRQVLTTTPTLPWPAPGQPHQDLQAVHSRSSITPNQPAAQVCQHGSTTATTTDPTPRRQISPITRLATLTDQYA